MRLKRRSFIRHGAALAAFGALPFVFKRRAKAADYGPLLADPDDILDLPEGFSYRIIDRRGDRMSDGYRVPAKPDGMACFAGEEGRIVLLRNHEVTTSSSEGPYGGESAPSEAYSDDAYGGVTRVVLNATTFERVSSNLVLTGTMQNCAGGPSPWGWLTCEESFDDAHGYVFACAVDAETVAPPQRIVGYGHFRHEAVAIEPGSLCAYLTEDRDDSCLYRFVPDDPEEPFTGRLQALGITGRAGMSTSSGLDVGDELDVTWVELDDPDPDTDSLRATARGDGAAVFRRGEGIWYHQGVVYFTCTSGGPEGLGQIFALRPTATGGTLTLIAQSDGAATLNGPDNLTMAPWGDLIVCEDALSGGAHRLRGLTPAGEFYDLARTTRSELAGVSFSPDGRALFVNIWSPGITLVVTGPFPTAGPGAPGTGGQGGEAGAAEPAGGAGETGAAPNTGGSSGSASADAGRPTVPASGGASGSGASAGATAGSPASASGSGGGGQAGGSSMSSGSGTGATAGVGTGGAGRAGAAAVSPSTPPLDSPGDCACHVPGAPTNTSSGALGILAVAAAAALRRTDE